MIACRVTCLPTQPSKTVALIEGLERAVEHDSYVGMTSLLQRLDGDAFKDVENGSGKISEIIGSSLDPLIERV
jgi:hypothetical protein